MTANALISLPSNPLVDSITTRGFVCIEQRESCMPESKFAEVEAFVQKCKYASCFDMMKEFHFSYAQSVAYMNILEANGIIDIELPDDPKGQGQVTRSRCFYCFQVDGRPFCISADGGRKLLNGKPQRQKPTEKKPVEEEKHEQKEKPKPTLVVEQPVPKVRKRTKLRAKR